MRRTALCLSAAAIVTFAATGPASAHAGLMPGEVAPGATVESELLLVHGCGPGGTLPTGDSLGSPTNRVTLAVPEGLDLAAQPDASWTVADEGHRLTFEARDAAGIDGVVRLAVAVTAERGLAEGSLWVPMVQECTDGEQLAWTSEGIEHAAVLPAARITVDRLAGLSLAEREARGQLPTAVVLSLLLALAVAAGGGVYAFSGRRDADASVSASGRRTR